MMKPYLKALSVLCVLILIGWIPAHAPAQSAGKKLKIAGAGVVFLYLPLQFALEKGYFQKEGLDVTLYSAGRRDLAMKAVMAGEAFASVHDPVETAFARARGAQVKIIAPVVTTATYWLIGDKDITLDPKTWRGKTVALATPPNALHSFFLNELRQGNWVEVDPTTYKLKADTDPSQYLKLLYGTWGTDVALLMAGRAQMTLTLEPGVSTALIKGGKHIIKDYASELGLFLTSTIQVSEDTIKNDRATVQRFVNALTNAYRDALADPSELAAVAVRWPVFSAVDPAVIRAATKRMILANAFGTTTMISKEAYQKNLGYFAIAQPTHPAVQVKWEEVSDMSFAEQALTVK